MVSRDTINTDVTAAAGCVALGLMFLRTGNAAVADRLTLPDTQVLLEAIRPDLLLPRVLARSIIMWDTILPTVEWAESHCSPLLASYRIGSYAPDVALGVSVDEQTFRQSYANAVAGACLAIALRFAGSADSEAVDTLFHFINVFSSTRLGKGGEVAGRSTMETCLGCVVISLGAVLAGTGDIRALQTMRKLRARISPDVRRGDGANREQTRERERRGGNNCKSSFVS
eukprot:m.431764 g.431764  ORF g.431764 m.431764 type:complete len:228 (-) comp20243_c11_seq4:28-711(-)